MAAGIMQPSRSTFSSPALVVKKKDGNWSLCIDYKALNAITVKDRYPITAIDDLISFMQLHGSLNRIFKPGTIK